MRPSWLSAPVAVTSTSSKAPPFSAPPVTWSPACFGTGMASPVSRLSSAVPRPSRTTPSAAMRSPGANHQQVVQAQAGDGDLGFHTGAPDAGALRAELRQGTDRLSGLAAGAALQPLADANEGDDGSRRLEIECGGVAGGELHGRQAERGARAKCHQRVHAAGAGKQGAVCAHVEPRAEHGFAPRPLAPVGRELAAGRPPRTASPASAPATGRRTGTPATPSRHH